MKCQMERTQWVRQLLTAPELHWFSLVVLTLTASMFSPIHSYSAKKYTPVIQTLKETSSNGASRVFHLVNTSQYNINSEHIISRQISCYTVNSLLERQKAGWKVIVVLYLQRGTIEAPLFSWSSLPTIDHSPGIESLSLPLLRWTAIIPIAQ